MIKLHDKGVYLVDGDTLCGSAEQVKALKGFCPKAEKAAAGSISRGILEKHNKSGDLKHLKLKFDSLTSHDITYVGIIQTARASGLTRFPVPYVLTNCHNSLCAVGGTINEDDHRFALSAARKFGGIYVPAHLANIHSYNREAAAACGRMILGSDSHTRYGALGCMGVGEGGGELAKQLLERTYDFDYPETVAVYLKGSPAPGVGPHDVALSIIGAVYDKGYTKNKIMEFVGPGVKSLPIEYRNAIDVMTTETACWSSVWVTDGETQRYFELHGRPEDYRELKPADVVYYDGCVEVDLSGVECMIALPVHPSNVFTIRELLNDAGDILRETEIRMNSQIKGASFDLMSKLKDGDIYVDQAEIAGCSGGTFDNIMAAADILRGGDAGHDVSLGIYPGSMPVLAELIRNGAASDLMLAGAVIREAFCGPCFGAGDCPANGELSIRHTTRNFPNREGSKPEEGQIAAVALMDARSIAATVARGGRLTAATDLDITYTDPDCRFDGSIYAKRVYNGWGSPEPRHELVFGPNIKDWTEMPALSEDLLLKICSYITDPVTTTDELIPSGETSSFRSNPERLSEFALSKRDPGYVSRSKAVRKTDRDRLSRAAANEAANLNMTGTADGAEELNGSGAANGENGASADEEILRVYEALSDYGVANDPASTNIGSAIFAMSPGDGSAREQAASCQRVLGGAADFAVSYATKRYRSNCVNWGIIPFLTDDPGILALGDYVFIPDIKSLISVNADTIRAYRVRKNNEDGTFYPVMEFSLSTGYLTADERQILLDGCLINHYKK